MGVCIRCLEGLTMTTVYLHAGTPKTATTSLQAFFKKNRALLKEHNFCYPIFKTEFPHIPHTRNGHFLYRAFTDEKHQLLDEPSPVYLQKLERLVEIGKTYDNILLSEEMLWQATDWCPDFWERIARDFAERGLEIKVIVYLRRQDLFVESYWKQSVKTYTQRTFKSYRKYLARRNSPLNYYEFLNGIAAQVGKENITARAFERGQFLNGSIYDDFLAILGLKMSDGFEIAEEERNIALEGNALELKRRLNAYLESGEESRNPAIKHALYELAASAEKTTHFESLQEQEEYLAQFAESNAQVAREYVGNADGVLFYDAVKELPHQEYRNKELLDDMMKVTAATTRNMELRVAELEEELRAAKIAGRVTWARLFKGVLRRLGVKTQ